MFTKEVATEMITCDQGQERSVAVAAGYREVGDKNVTYLRGGVFGFIDRAQKEAVNRIRKKSITLTKTGDEAYWEATGIVLKEFIQNEIVKKGITKITMIRVNHEGTDPAFFNNLFAAKAQEAGLTVVKSEFSSLKDALIRRGADRDTFNVV